MDYPTTGRRRQRSGAVSVAELVERSHPVDEDPVPTFEQTQTGATRHSARGATTILSADAPPEEAVSGTEEPASSTLAKICRTAGMTIGVLAVVAAVTTASTIDKQQPKQQPSTAPARYEITGVQALRPDAVAAHLGEQDAGAGTQRDGKASPLPSPSDGQADDRMPGNAGRPAHAHTDASTVPGSTTSAGVQFGKDASPAVVVRRFYQLLAKDPSRAVTLLAPKLIGSGTDAFVQSWSRMRALRVEQLADHPDGTVTAVVRTLQPDGSWLRVRQLITTTGGPLPMIDTVRLVSAQRG